MGLVSSSPNTRGPPEKTRDVLYNYPALAHAEEWMSNHRDPIPIKQHLQIPVLCLRWTHASINRKMMFGHDGIDDESMFKLVDQPLRGEKLPEDINQPLDVAQHQGHFCSQSNRRLSALMMYQALHRDRVVKAWCRICSSDTQKFEDANSTNNEGLGIEVRDGESQHFGGPLFQRGDFALHELNHLAQRHPDYVTDLTEWLAKIRSRPSARGTDGCSLTLTQSSQPQLS